MIFAKWLFQANLTFFLGFRDNRVLLKLLVIKFKSQLNLRPVNPLLTLGYGGTFY